MEAHVRQTFPGINPNAWEHPADRLALNALREVPGLDQAIKIFLGNTTERSLRLMFLASAVRVSPRQFPRVHDATEEVCQILGVAQMPEVYVIQNPFFNAGAVGWKDPFITLNSAAIAGLTDDELRNIIGHEMGHILSGHVLYKTLLYLLLNYSLFFNTIPLSRLAVMGLIAALREWDRKSELSADRAGLLCTQNPRISIQMLMKMAGGSFLEQMDMDEFIRQAEEYENANSLLDNTYKLLNLLDRSHPFTVVRVAELNKWANSEAYNAILRGEYAKGKTDFTDDFAQTANGYRQDFAKAAEPVEEVLRDVEKAFTSAGNEAKKLWDDFWKK